MKSKKILSLMLLCALSMGSVKSYAELSNDKVQKNKLMTETKSIEMNTDIEKPDEKITEKEAVQIAIEGFQNYFNKKYTAEDFNVRPLHLKNETGEQDCFLLDGSKENTLFFDALIDAKTGKILDISNHVNITSLSHDSEQVTIDTAKNTADNFIKKNNLIDMNKSKFLKEQSLEVTTLLSDFYYLYFNYDDNKTLLMLVNKYENAVESFIFFDEIKSVG